MLHRIFTLGLLAVAASALHAQTVTLLDESFEGASGGALPTGWVDANQSLGITVTNPATAGINSSATALTFTETTGNPIVNSGAIDLSSYVSAGVVDGYTFTLSFDLYDAANTDNHNLLIGYGSYGESGPTGWDITSTSASGLGSTHLDDLATAGVWEHFSFDVTSGINTNFDRSGSVSDFAVFVEAWSAIPGDASLLDNVKLTATATAVPEPATYAVLFGLAVLGVAGFRRRRAA